jgi:Rhomboid family
VERPATSAIIVLCSGIWIFIQQHGISYEDVGLIYERLVGQKEYWRIFSSQLSHIDFLHLIFNLSALWSLGVAEAYGAALGMGTAYYASLHSLCCGKVDAPFPSNPAVCTHTHDTAMVRLSLSSWSRAGKQTGCGGDVRHCHPRLPPRPIPASGSRGLLLRGFWVDDHSCCQVTGWAPSCAVPGATQLVIERSSAFRGSARGCLVLFVMLLVVLVQVANPATTFLGSPFPCIWCPSAP